MLKLFYFIVKLLHPLHQLETVILELAVEVCGVSTQMTHLELKCKHYLKFFKYTRYLLDYHNILFICLFNS